jgi:predicted nucleic acid-binding protein
VIVVDTSVWIDHLKSGDSVLADLLGAGRVLAHPFVTGELALGSLRQRRTVLMSHLSDLVHLGLAERDVRGHCPDRRVAARRCDDAVPVHHRGHGIEETSCLQHKDKGKVRHLG